MAADESKNISTALSVSFSTPIDAQRRSGCEEMECGCLVISRADRPTATGQLIIELPFYYQSALATAGSGSHPGTVLVEGRLLASLLGNSGNGVVFETGDMSHQPKVVGLDVDLVAFTLDRQGRDVQTLACL